MDSSWCWIYFWRAIRLFDVSSLEAAMSRSILFLVKKKTWLEYLARNMDWPLKVLALFPHVLGVTMEKRIDRKWNSFNAKPACGCVDGYLHLRWWCSINHKALSMSSHMLLFRNLCKNQSFTLFVCNLNLIRTLSFYMQSVLEK